MMFSVRRHALHRLLNNPFTEMTKPAERSAGFLPSGFATDARCHEETCGVQTNALKAEKFSSNPTHLKPGATMASDPLPITQSITIAGWELVEQFVRASGPGGQNVNKVSSSVQLRFDARSSPSLPERVKTNLVALAGQRMTKDGVIIIEADRFRTQDRNRKDARDRLKDLVAKAAAPPPPYRRKTKPTKGSVERRLKAKSSRSGIKKLRGNIPPD